MGIPNFLKADSRLTLPGESVAVLLEILCLLGADGRPTLLVENIAESRLTLGSGGILVTFFSRTYLSTLVDRATRSLGQLIIAPVSDVTCN